MYFVQFIAVVKNECGKDDQLGLDLCRVVRSSFESSSQMLFLRDTQLNRELLTLSFRREFSTNIYFVVVEMLYVIRYCVFLGAVRAPERFPTNCRRIYVRLQLLKSRTLSVTAIFWEQSGLLRIWLSTNCRIGLIDDQSI